ncbi:hypothetical protein ACA910_003001 [Epithemia clementina (nom. ined.)]
MEMGLWRSRCSLALTTVFVWFVIDSSAVRTQEDGAFLSSIHFTSTSSDDAASTSFSETSSTSLPQTMLDPEFEHRSPRGLKQQQQGIFDDANFQRGYIDSLGTLYEEAAQAWRILGAYIECGDKGYRGGDDDEDDRRQRQKRRHLEGDGEEGNHDSGSGSGSGDGGSDDGDSSRQCSRYLLWAAYVDVNYEGGGLGEYKFFNPEGKKWDDTTCRESGSRRCVRLDCHMESSNNFRLLGYYKQYNINEFLEQLVKHHGSCTWTSTLQTLMSSTLDFWPDGCSYSGVSTSDGIDLYLDIHPQWGGGITMQLFEDETCLSPYDGTDVTLAQAWQTYTQKYGGDDGYSYKNVYQDSSLPELGSADYFHAWNKALSTYQLCQPCKVSSIYSHLNQENQRRRLEDSENNNEPFQCQDSTGEVNLNQCAVFAKKTQVSPAYFNDLQRAIRQGSIPIPKSHMVTRSNDYSFDQWQHNWGFFCFSFLAFVVGMVTFACLVKIKTRVRVNPNGGSEPLIMTVTPRTLSLASSVASPMVHSSSARSTTTTPIAKINSSASNNTPAINTINSNAHNAHSTNDHTSAGNSTSARAAVVSMGRPRSKNGGDRGVAPYHAYNDQNAVVLPEPMNSSGNGVASNPYQHPAANMAAPNLRSSARVPRPEWPDEAEEGRDSPESVFEND